MVFRTLQNIYDGAFLILLLIKSTCLLFLLFLLVFLPATKLGWRTMCNFTYYWLILMGKQKLQNKRRNNAPRCVKNVQIRSFFWSVFPRTQAKYGDLLRKYPYSARVRENTDQKKLHI